MNKQKTKFKQTEIGKIPEESLKENCTEIQYGYTQSASEENVGPKFLRITDIQDKMIDWQSVPYCKISEEDYKKYKLVDGDILIARTGASTGTNAIYREGMPDAVFASYLIRLKVNSRFIPRFVYYFLQSPTYKEHIESTIGGSAQPNANAQQLTDIPIPLFPLSEQRAIASILSSLDSKIELNRQMNKTLEAIGQAIFKHWFVDFEFPNEEGKPYRSSGGEMVDSELGGIPKGWKVSKIGDEFETILGGTPSTANKSYWDNGTIPWINSGKINEFRIVEPTAFITEEAVNNSATKLMPKGTTVLAITGATLGQVSRIEIDTCANQSVIGILENKELKEFPSEYIYFWIKHKINDLIAHQTGGAQQHINKNNVNTLQIIMPDKDTIIDFIQIIKPIFNQISNRCFESQNLSQIRDFLLPKLMSGRIRVPLEVRA